MTSEELIQQMASELAYTAKALKTIVTNYDMEPMARDLINTRIINLEAKCNLLTNQSKLEALLHAS